MDIIIWILQSYTMVSHKIMMDHLSRIIWGTWIWYTDNVPQSSISLKYDGRWMDLTINLASSAFPLINGPHTERWGPWGLVERAGPHSGPWAIAISWFSYRVLEGLRFPLLRNQIFAWNCQFLWILGRDDLKGGLFGHRYRTGWQNKKERA